MQWDLVSRLQRIQSATDTLTSDVPLLHCLVFADIYSRVLYCGIMDPNTPIQEKHFILREYNKYMSSPIPYHLRALCLFAWSHLLSSNKHTKEK